MATKHALRPCLDAPRALRYQSQPPEARNPRHKDGILHFVGVIGFILHDVRTRLPTLADPWRFAETVSR